MKNNKNFIRHQRPHSNVAIVGNVKIENAGNEIDSFRTSNISSEENAGTMATTSLLEGSVGVQLPTSKINAAAQRHKLTKN